MTPRQLTDLLAEVLSDLLGTYKRPDGGTQAAIFLGEPPSDWNATGLEVRVDPSVEFDNRSLHQHTAIVTEIPVRVIPRGGSGTEAVTRISQRFDATNPRTVPSNERLGILKTYTLQVRS